MRAPKIIIRQADRSARALSPKLLSVAQTCGVLSIGRTKFYGLVAAERLAVLKLGRRTLVRAETLDAFIASLNTPTTNTERDRKPTL